MKRVFNRITAAILISGSLVACGPNNDSTQASGNIRVMAPLHSEGGKYSLSVVELLAVSDLSTLAGKFVKFFFSPRVVNSHLEGSAPKTRFLLNSDGIQVPTDETTMQMAAIYAHLQRLAALDEELGAGGINKWPRDVGLAVRVAGNLKNNAFYEGKTDSMLVVPYTNQDLPIAINGGILAHEHFHSLFYKAVLGEAKANIHNEEIKEVFGNDFSETLIGKALPESPDVRSLDDKQLNYYYHVALTRGLNEGLADFWGWMYTGDPDFITQSLPTEKDRTLKVSETLAARVLSSEGRIKAEVKRRFTFSQSNNMDFNALLNGYAYMLGTEFSRSLKFYTDLYAKAHDIGSVDARKEVAKGIIRMLPSLREELSQSETKVFTAQSFIQSFAKNMKMATEQECSYLATLVNRASASGSSKTTECRKSDEGWNLAVVLTITDTIKPPPQEKSSVKEKPE